MLEEKYDRFASLFQRESLLYTEKCNNLDPGWDPVECNRTHGEVIAIRFVMYHFFNNHFYLLVSKQL